MTRHSSIPLTAALLFVPLSFTERYEDTGRACVVPRDVECFLSFSDESDTGLEMEYCDLWSNSCDCEGLYPANEAYELHAYMSSGGGGYTKKAKCSVELVGDHHLSVEGSYKQLPERDAIVEPAAEASCTTPVLAAGIWTLSYGDGEVMFRVGDDEVQQMACASGSG
jgi:hypothetical protein